MFVVANGQITIFQKKFSEKKNDNVQKTANATPSTTLALYVTLIHTMLIFGSWKLEKQKIFS